MLKVLSGSPMGFIKGTPDGYNYNTYPINVKMGMSRGVAGGKNYGSSFVNVTVSKSTIALQSHSGWLSPCSHA